MSNTNLSAADKANNDRIADVALNIREALNASLPTPPEQHLTVMVPGKVLNLQDYTVTSEALLLPKRTELMNAMLCDDMPPLSTIAMGPTGKSVARSYAAAITKLIPAGTPIGIQTDQMDAQQRRYAQAMDWLRADAPNTALKITRVELYTQKQAKYTDAVSNKNKAFEDALKLAATTHPGSPDLAQEMYLTWVAESAPAFRNSVQAAYMDWVIMGLKEEVEYWFAVVDQDTALARVEKSKETMRLSVVQDEDGSTEFNKVRLVPSNWANLCLDKIGKKPTGPTYESLTFEIERYEKANSLLDVLKSHKTLLDPGINAFHLLKETQRLTEQLQSLPADASEKDRKDLQDKLDKAKKDFEAAGSIADVEAAKKVVTKAGEDLKAATESKKDQATIEGAQRDLTNARAALADISADAALQSAQTTLGNATANHLQNEAAYKAAAAGKDLVTPEELKTLEARMQTSRKTVEDAQANVDKAKVAAQMGTLRERQYSQLERLRSDSGYLNAQLKSNQAKIKDLQMQRDDLRGQSQPSDLLSSFASSAEVNLPSDVTQAPPSATPTPATTFVDPADYFTSISIDSSSSSAVESQSKVSSSYSMGASGSYGFFSGGLQVSHSSAHAEAMAEMMNSNVKISFDVMRVDITRNWLRGELFYDDDLVSGPGEHISPGFGKLKDLMSQNDPAAEVDKQLYSAFPMYPTAFLVACNVVLEISGSTSSLQTYMNSSSTSVQAKISYGPFGSANMSSSTSKEDSGSTCKATASGCRIEMRAPQVIGWVCQLLPALPRLKLDA